MIQLITLCLATVVLVIFAAGVVPYALYTAGAILTLGAVIAGIRLRKRRGRPRKLLVCLAAVSVVWLLITALPLSDHILGIDANAQMPTPVESDDGPAPLSRVELQTRARQGLLQAKELKLVQDADQRFSLSLNRAGTLRIVVLLISAWAAAFLASSMTAKHKFWFLRFLIAVGVILAGGGIVCRYIMPSEDTIWWFLPLPAEQAMGAFVNVNHFGAFLAMLVPAVLAQGVQDIRAREWERLALWVAALILLMVGVIASQSRGAYICLAASLSVTGLLFLTPRRKRTSMALAACVLVAIFLLTALSTPDMERELDTLQSMIDKRPARVELWRTSLAIWRDFPIIGAGAEGYRTISTHYNFSTSKTYFHHAESTYVQILCDLGLVGAAWTVSLLGVIIWELVGKVRNRRFSMTLMISAAGACLVVLLHGLYDFAIHVPLYGIIAAAYFGMLLGRPASAHQNRTVMPERPDKPWYDRWLVPVLSLSGLLVIAGIALTWGDAVYLRDKQWFLADPDAHIRELPAREALVRQPEALPASADTDSPAIAEAVLPDNATDTPHFREPIDVIADNLAWTPAYWANWFYLAQHSAAGWDLRNYRLAERALTRAAWLNPGNTHIWLQLSNLRARLGQAEAAGKAYARYLEELTPAARRQQGE